MAASCSPRRAQLVCSVNPLRTRYSIVPPMMVTRSDFNYKRMEISCRAYNNQLNRTMLQSDFDYRFAEFTSQAIGNRHKRHQRITPIMKWEFQKDLHNLMGKIRDIKPVVDDHPPRRPNVVQWRKNREEHEQIRLDAITKENHEMLDRLRKIQNRPRSSFCHLKRRGDYLVKGDAFSLPPPKRSGNYLVQMYKKLKLSNPVVARKSIRVQQEMLTSTVSLVQKSDKNKPLEKMIEYEVQWTLTKEDEILPKPKRKPQTLSPVEIVQLVAPKIDAKVLDDIVMAMSPTLPKPSVGKEESLDANQPQNLEAKTPPFEASSDVVQSAETSETPSVTTQSVTMSETPGVTNQSVTTCDALGMTTQIVTTSETPVASTKSITLSESKSSGRNSQ